MMDNEKQAIPSRTTKRTSKKPLTVQEKQSVVNIFQNLTENNPSTSVTKLYKMTAQASGLAVSTVYNVMKEYKSGKLVSPRARSGRPSKIKKLDEKAKNYIRRKIHSLFLNNELPTVDNVKAALDSDKDNDLVPSMGRSSWHKVLREMGLYNKSSEEHTSLTSESSDLPAKKQKLEETPDDAKMQRKTDYSIVSNASSQKENLSKCSGFNLYAGFVKNEVNDDVISCKNGCISGIKVEKDVEHITKIKTEIDADDKVASFSIVTKTEIKNEDEDSGLKDEEFIIKEEICDGEECDYWTVTIP